MKRILYLLTAAVLVMVLGCAAAFAHHGGGCGYRDSYVSCQPSCDRDGGGPCGHTWAACGDTDGDGLCDLCGTAHLGWTGGHHGGHHGGGHHGWR